MCKSQILPVASSGSEDRNSLPRFDLARKRNCKCARTGGNFQPDSRSKTTSVSKRWIDNPSSDFDHVLAFLPKAAEHSGELLSAKKRFSQARGTALRERMHTNTPGE